jgi:cytochrome P450
MQHLNCYHFMTFCNFFFRNGEEWYRLRSAVQQFMLKPSAVAHFLPLVDGAAQQLVERIAATVGSTGGEIESLRDEIAKWSLECKYYYYQTFTQSPITSPSNAKTLFETET